LRDRFRFNYLERKGKLLEAQVGQTLRRMFPLEDVTEAVLVERGSHERDFVAVSGSVVLCVEAKGVQRRVQSLSFRKALLDLRKNFKVGPEEALRQAHQHAVALEEHRIEGRPQRALQNRTPMGSSKPHTSG
jgi:hypothetical protein